MISSLALKDISLGSEWSKGLKGPNSVTWTPTVASRSVRPYGVPIRAGFGLDLSGCTGLQPPQGKITERLLPPMPLIFGKKKKMLFSFQKVLPETLLEAEGLRKASTQRGRPHIPSLSKKIKRSFGPRETKGSIQDLVAASCQHRMGSIQTPKVWFFVARQCW